MNIVEHLKAKGAFLEVLDRHSCRRERQLGGIEAAKKRGVYKGRPENVELKNKIRELRATGLSLSKCAAAQCSISTVQRALKD
ncbi:hypothetical protein [Shewanella chilikensis]|uniref:hypothetical protein n=1 Tax=Shewanella chilikensis TaxID=558541 RepID=UPI00399A9436